MYPQGGRDLTKGEMNALNLRDLSPLFDHAPLCSLFFPQSNA